MSSRRHRSWWSGITPAGLIGMVTSALTTLAITGVGCWVCAKNNVDDGLKILGLAGFSGIGTNSLLARTRPDPAATVDPPAAITAEPVETLPD